MQTVKKYVLKNGLYVPFVDRGDGTLIEAIWAPQPGSQEAALKVDPSVELLLAGPRGTGKTITALMMFIRNVGKYGQGYRGHVFRRSHTQFKDLVAMTQQYFPRIIPGATFNIMRNYWDFPTGERLYFSHMDHIGDYDNLHGGSFQFMFWSEITRWQIDDCYVKAFSVLRSDVPGMPLQIVADANPEGVGAAWVMRRWHLPLSSPQKMIGPVIREKDERGFEMPPRMVIQSQRAENILLRLTTPNYEQNLRASAKKSGLEGAWLDGIWSTETGSIFENFWRDYTANIYVPPFTVPDNWMIYRAMDPGVSKPTAVLWLARSNGEDIVAADGKTQLRSLAGDLFVVHEMYTSTGKANEGTYMLAPEICQRIIKLENEWGYRNGRKCRVRTGPADTQIFEKSAGGTGICLADIYERHGVEWIEAQKGPGSRVQGWTLLRQLFMATKPEKDSIREERGLFIVESECPNLVRTIPLLARSESKPDDVITGTEGEVEDHLADALRMAVRFDTSPSWTSRRIRM